MTSTEKKIDEVNLYVRVPEELAAELDLRCARERIKRPEGIKRALEKWLAPASPDIQISPDSVPFGSAIDSAHYGRSGSVSDSQLRARVVSKLREAEALLQGSLEEDSEPPKTNRKSPKKRAGGG